MSNPIVEQKNLSESHSDNEINPVNIVTGTDISITDSGRLIVKIILYDEDEHSVRADAVANMIIAISALINESMSQMKYPEVIETRVANFQKGSLEIPFDLFVPMIGFIPGTINIINDAVEFVRNYLRIKMAFFGKKVKDETEFKEMRQQAITEGTISNSNNITYNTYNNCTINSYINQATSELKDDPKVQSVEIFQSENSSESVTIPREKFSDFIIPEPDVDEENDKKKFTVETELTIISPNFKKGKWKVVYDKRQISVSMVDKVFRERVEKRTVSFKSGDRLKARLEIVMKYDSTVDEYLVDETKYRVVEVIDIVTPPAKEEKDLKIKDVINNENRFLDFGEEET